MKIQDVKNAKKVADIVLILNDLRKLIRFIKEQPNDLRTHIYFLVINDMIFKVGGSSGKNGLYQNISFYELGFSGDPNEDRMFLQLCVAAELRRGSKCELWYIPIPNQSEMVMGLNSQQIEEVKPSHKHSEANMLKEILNIDNEYPRLNVQERGISYPPQFIKMFNNYVRNKENNMLPIGGKHKKSDELYKEYTDQQKLEFLALINAAVDEYYTLNSVDMKLEVQV